MQLDTQVQAIGRILATYRLEVPIHQRAYAWVASEEVAQLWEDVVRATHEEPDGYFIGPLVLGEAAAATGRLNVIDGQQRLATVSLVFAAMASVFLERGEQERCRLIADEFLRHKNINTLDDEPNLLLGDADRAYFTNVVLAAVSGAPIPEPNPRKPSQQLIVDAYCKLKELLEGHSPATAADWSDRLLNLRTYLVEQTKTILVLPGSEENAYLIFETLNGRGLRLTTTDLLKNYLFGKAGAAHLDRVRNAWVEMVTALEDGGLPEATTFLRHFWISSRDSVREMALYRTICRDVRTSTAVRELTDSLADSANKYVALANPSHRLWTNQGTPLRQALCELSLFRVETARPLLLAASEKLPPAMFSKIVCAVARWSIRLAIAGGLGSGSLEEAYGRAARKIRRGEITDDTQLQGDLAALLPTDSVFRAAFAVKEMSRGPQVRHLLVGLERQARLDSGLQADVGAVEDETLVNWEHVMPRNPPPGGWDGVPADVHAAYVNRLGNSALMLATANSGAANETFSAKKKRYLQSELLLTREIGNQSVWSSKEIEERQGRMADLAVRYWPL
jgi:hypothetical protein